MTPDVVSAGEISQAIFGGMFAAALVYAAWSDVRTLEISNSISLIIAGAFIVAAMLGGLDGAALLHHGSVALAFLIGGALLFGVGIFGGADAKLLAAIGLWLDWNIAGPFLFVVAVCGGVLALVVLVITRLAPLRHAIAPLGLPWTEQANGRGQPIPYGVAIAAGGVFMLPRMATIPDFIRDLITG